MSNDLSRYMIPIFNKTNIRTMNVDFGSDDNYVGDKPGLGVRLCPESCR